MKTQMTANIGTLLKVLILCVIWCAGFVNQMKMANWHPSRSGVKLLQRFKYRTFIKCWCITLNLRRKHPQQCKH